MGRCRQGVGRRAAARRHVLRARPRCVGQQGTVIHGRSSDHGRGGAGKSAGGGAEERRVVDTGGAGASLVVLSSTAHRVGRSRAIQIWRQHDEQHNAACVCGLLLMMLWNAARSGRKKQCAGSCRA